MKDHGAQLPTIDVLNSRSNSNNDLFSTQWLFKDFQIQLENISYYPALVSILHEQTRLLLGSQYLSIGGAINLYCLDKFSDIIVGGASNDWHLVKNN